MTLHIEDILPNIEISKSHRKKSDHLLAKIGKVSGGVLKDVKINRNQLAKFEENKIKDVLFSRMVKYKNQVQPSDSGSTKSTSLTSPLFTKFFNNPTFANYVSCFLLNDIALSDSVLKSRSLGGAIVLELSYVFEELKTRANAGDPLYTKLASDILLENKLLREASRIKTISAARISGGILIGSQYLQEVTKLIDQSKSSIKIIMFYFWYGGRRNHPTTGLTKSLKQAIKRGVNVQVILDQDKISDKYNSTQINSSALKQLKKIGANAKYDSKENVTHTKIVLIDNQKVVIGSHNWTANSLRNYHDISVLISSRPVAKSYATDFDLRFRKL